MDTCLQCGKMLNEERGKGAWLRINSQSAVDHCQDCWNETVAAQEGKPMPKTALLSQEEREGQIQLDQRVVESLRTAGGAFTGDACRFITDQKGRGFQTKGWTRKHYGQWRSLARYREVRECTRNKFGLLHPDERAALI